MIQSSLVCKLLHTSSSFSEPLPALLCSLLRWGGQSCRQSPRCGQTVGFYNSLQIVLGNPNIFNHFRLPVSGVKLPEEMYTNESILKGKTCVFTFDAMCLFTYFCHMNPTGRITWMQLLADMSSSMEIKWWSRNVNRYKRRYQKFVDLLGEVSGTGGQKALGLQTTPTDPTNQASELPSLSAP